MGRFHRHDDGTVHEHEHDGHGHEAHGGHGPEHGELHPHNGLAPTSPDEAAQATSAAHLGDHAGYDTGRERIEVLERIFSENDAAAAANRALFDAAGVVAINIMSSPGSGKTTLLAKTLAALRGTDDQPGLRCGVVEGDIETAIDADRLRGLGAQVSLLNTAAGFGGECHLDAPMVAHALGGLDLTTLDLVFIENVGNLVCPAEFDVGAHRKAMVASVTEGEDKPLKYPVMFRSVDAIVVNKIDLLPHLNFDLGLFLANIALVNPRAQVFETSATTGEGIAEWVKWVRMAVPE